MVSRSSRQNQHVSRDPHLSKPCDRHFPSNVNRKEQLSLGGWDSRMTFAIRQSVMTARASKSASATSDKTICSTDRRLPR